MTKHNAYYWWMGERPDKAYYATIEATKEAARAYIDKLEAPKQDS